MKKQLIDYILKQKIVNLNVVNSLVDDSTFSGGNSVFWDGEITNLVQAMFINGDDYENSYPMEIYCVSDITFSSVEELKNKTFCVITETENEKNKEIFGGKIDGEIATLFYDLKNSKNFGAVLGNATTILNVQDPGHCCFKIGNDETNLFCEKKGIYFYKFQYNSKITYPFLITDEF